MLLSELLILLGLWAAFLLLLDPDGFRRRIRTQMIRPDSDRPYRIPERTGSHRG